MAKSYVEIEFKEPPKAFYFERGGEKFFLDSIQKLGWYKSDYQPPIFDIMVETEAHDEAELNYDEWFVVFPDGSGRPYEKSEFELLYKTK